MTQNDVLAICSFFGSSACYGFDCGEQETADTDKIIRDEDNGAEASGGDTTKNSYNFFHVPRQTTFFEF